MSDNEDPFPLTYEQILDLYVRIPKQYQNPRTWRCLHGNEFVECEEEACLAVKAQLREIEEESA